MTQQLRAVVLCSSTNVWFPPATSCGPQPLINQDGCCSVGLIKFDGFNRALK